MPATVEHRKQAKRINAVKVMPPSIGGFLAYLAVERGLARNTLAAYRRDLTDLAGELEQKGIPFDPPSADVLQEYLRGQSRLKKTATTVTRRLAAIRSYLKYLLIHGQDTSAVLDNLERPKPERPIPKILSRAQVETLLKGQDPTSKFYYRDVAIIELLYAAGLRASELCDLTIEAMNLQEGCVRVTGKGNKTRLVPIGGPCNLALEDYLKNLRPLLDKRRAPQVFLSKSGRPLERVALWMLIDKLARQSGLNKHISPHVLRHCFASHLVSGGADLRIVQELLGHADVNTTQVYTHVDVDRIKSVHHDNHPRERQARGLPAKRRIGQK